MKSALLFILLIVILFIFIDSEWIQQLRSENIDYFTNELFDEMGYGMLFVTIPLMAVQGVLTFFPVIVLIIIHFFVFGIVEGFLFSMVGTSLGALFCFWLSRSLSERYVNRMWKKKTKTLQKLMYAISQYGVFIIVFLRSLPFMPSNLISIAAAFSPINSRQYILSTIFGNLSMVWLLSILALPLWYGGESSSTYVIAYLVYAALLVGILAIQFFRKDVQKVREK
ncbi:TVP38/TMEM64 family protein [Evansella halocellulosilytica]|uniref:TVP38/TMEM64 family protein n=1 Tax=Evansella halocellulosilytica TaxID=2011013 RepID=UPI000BB821E7|nr:VTT domain-containing protein [Evansella halocellulosilytica]